MPQGLPPSRIAAYTRMLQMRRNAVLRALSIATEDDPGLRNVSEEDQAAVSHDDFVSSQMNHLDYRQLRLINEALDRIASGDYGICCSCEEPIPPKRLRALPWAKYCLNCQEQADPAGSTVSWRPAIPYRHPDHT